MREARRLLYPEQTGQQEEVGGQEAIRKYRDVFLLLTFLPLCPGDLLLLVGLPALALLRYYAPYYTLQRRGEERKKEVEDELLTVISRLSLSLRSGSLLQEAWQEVTQSQEGPLYEEMKRTSERIREGMGAEEAYRAFGQSYGLEHLRDMGQLLAESLQLGSGKLCQELDLLRDREVKRRKRSLQMEADRAAQKMMYPGLLIFIAILLLVMVPLLGEALG